MGGVRPRAPPGVELSADEDVCRARDATMGFFNKPLRGDDESGIECFFNSLLGLCPTMNIPRQKTSREKLKTEKRQYAAISTFLSSSVLTAAAIAFRVIGFLTKAPAPNFCACITRSVSEYPDTIIAFCSGENSRIR